MNDIVETKDKIERAATRVIAEPKQGKYILTELRHGGHYSLDRSERATLLATTEVSVPAQARQDVVEEMTEFNYLFADLARNPDKLLPADDPASVVDALKVLGDAMVEDPAPADDPLQSTGNSTIPPVYTYWGQFVDHDLTANTDRRSVVGDIVDEGLVPLHPDDVIRDLKNLRNPRLNLDSLYADGPQLSSVPRAAAGFYNGVRFRIGTNAVNPEGDPSPEIPPQAQVPPPHDDLARDLPRIGTLLDAGVISTDDIPEAIRQRPNVRSKAFIGDARNDENLIIAQLHLAFLRFHNNVVNWVQVNEDRTVEDAQLFERARDLVRWHYQWLTVHDFLKTVTLPGTADRILFDGPKLYARREGQLYMPLEHSVAAYRFGHSMVRGVYDFNRNFGRNPADPEQDGLVLDNSNFTLLFQFTGNGSPAPFLGQAEVLPFSWIIEWDRFVDKGSSTPDHFARKIDTQLAPPLRDLVNEGNDPGLPAGIREILKRLARRNLLRGYLLSIPTGQAVAEEIGVRPLSADELRPADRPAIAQALDDGGFIERTPLWYYVLRESEVRANGNSLGEVGSRIVCDTIIGLIVNDPRSYLNQPGGWDPSKGVRLPNGDPIVTIADMLRFAGVLPEHGQS